MLWEDTEDEAPLPLVPSSSDGKVAEALLQHNPPPRTVYWTWAAAPTCLAEMVTMTMESGRGWPLLHGDLAQRHPLLLPPQLGTVLVHGRAAVGKAANVAALVPADGTQSPCCFYSPPVSRTAQTKGLEQRNINGVILIIELGDKVGFLQHLQALSLSFVTN